MSHRRPSWKHTSMWSGKRVYVCIGVRLCMFVHVCVRRCVYVCVCGRVLYSVNACVHTSKHMYEHTPVCVHKRLRICQHDPTHPHYISATPVRALETYKYPARNRWACSVHAREGVCWCVVSSVQGTGSYTRLPRRNKNYRTCAFLETRRSVQRSSNSI